MSINQDVHWEPTICEGKGEASTVAAVSATLKSCIPVVNRIVAGINDGPGFHCKSRFEFMGFRVVTSGKHGKFLATEEFLLKAKRRS